MKTAAMITVVLCLGAAIGQTDAQNPSLIINVDNRNTISLNGKWHAIIDVINKGYMDWENKPLKNGFFIDKKPKDKSDLVEYSFDLSDTLDVPGGWNSQRPELLYYEGPIWYKKSFDYSLPANKRLFVYFSAVNYLARVYLNGQSLGEHRGGYTPFNFEITDKVRETGNFLIVQADNSRQKDNVPSNQQDWWNYGGITRHVMLIETPQTFIQDYCVQLKKNDPGTIAGSVRLNGPQPSQSVTIEIPEAKIEYHCKTDENGYAQFEFPATLTLWRPLHPKLYQVIIKSQTDRIEDQIGFRTLAAQGREILVNGKPIFIRGICVSEENPLRRSNACTPEDATLILNWVQELGCNFVRMAHWPYNEYFVREADRRGIMLWEEIPVYWQVEWENPNTYACAEQQLTEIITRDKNRAAVIFWSIGNETNQIEPRLVFSKKLLACGRTLDPTRLMTAAVERVQDEKDPSKIIINDKLVEELDVVGCNEYFGWYHEMPGLIGDLTWTMPCEKPLIMSEFGAGALAGCHGDRLTRWTEEFQEFFMQDQLKMLGNIPFLRGTSPWLLFDFRDPRRLLPGFQDGWLRKGLISDQGMKKKAFFIIRDFYAEIALKYPD